MIVFQRFLVFAFALLTMLVFLSEGSAEATDRTRGHDPLEGTFPWTSVGQPLPDGGGISALVAPNEDFIVGGSAGTGAPSVFAYHVATGTFAGPFPVPGGSDYVSRLVSHPLASTMEVYVVNSKPYGEGNLARFDLTSGTVEDLGGINGEYGESAAVGLDGRVYIGKCCQGRISIYDPATDGWTHLGRVVADKLRITGMAPGLDGHIYFTTSRIWITPYGGAALYKLDTETYAVTAIGSLATGLHESYNLVLNPVDGKLYGSVGYMMEARLFAYDPAEPAAGIVDLGVAYPNAEQIPAGAMGVTVYGKLYAATSPVPYNRMVTYDPADPAAGIVDLGQNVEAGPPMAISRSGPFFMHRAGKLMISLEAAQEKAPVPRSTDQTFVTSSGYPLDAYLYRPDLPDGKLTFSIPIDRFYFHPDDVGASDAVGTNIHFDEDGFLTPESVQYALNKNLLPAAATLTLSAYDVNAEDPGCPEVDYVWINGFPVGPGSPTGTLSGAPKTWSAVSFDVPIQYLRLPQQKGDAGSRPEAATNEVTIEIDALECGGPDQPYWGVQLDWGAIEIESPIRPLLLVHGWTGNETAFQTFWDALRADGIPTASPKNYNDGINWIDDTAAVLEEEIRKTAAEFGVEKVNIWAHSKGGLVTRYALRQEAAQSVEHVVTFATPHHGSTQAEINAAVAKICQWRFEPDLEKETACFAAAQEFRTDTIRDFFNYEGCIRNESTGEWSGCIPRYVKAPSVTYYSFTARLDEAVRPLRSTTYPWIADGRPMPDNLATDESFLTSHSGILSDLAPYRCAIAYLDSRIYAPQDHCPSQRGPAHGLPAAAPNSSVEPQSVATQTGALAGGETDSMAAFVDGGTVAVFTAWLSADTDFTLRTPTGQIIDSAAAAADPDITYSAAADGTLLVKTYTIASPAVGVWESELSAVAAGEYVMDASVATETWLRVTTSRPTVQPSQTITITARLTTSGTPNASAVITGTMALPNGTATALDLHDDGTAGDAVAGDGIFTATPVAPAEEGLLLIDVAAQMGSVTRQTGRNVVIASQSARATGVASVTVSDNNGNNLYDELTIGVQLDVLEAGEFEIAGQLVDSQGNTIATGFYSTVFEGNVLQPGTHTLPLTFDGSTIREHGVDGPYTLTNVALFDVSMARAHVDTQTDFFTTDAYSVASFERPLIRLLSTGEIPSDADGNGRYDLLSVQLQFDLVEAGTYRFNARLVDQLSGEIGWQTGSFTAGAAGIYDAWLVFDGAAIGRHDVDGPFFVTNLTITNGNGVAGALIQTAHVTEPYRTSEFEEGWYRLYLPAAQLSGPG